MRSHIDDTETPLTLLPRAIMEHPGSANSFQYTFPNDCVALNSGLLATSDNNAVEHSLISSIASIAYCTMQYQQQCYN